MWASTGILILENNRSSSLSTDSNGSIGYSSILTERVDESNNSLWKARQLNRKQWRVKYNHEAYDSDSSTCFRPQPMGYDS